jgi:hypothetical protein
MMCRLVRVLAALSIAASAIAACASPAAGPTSRPSPRFNDIVIETHDLLSSGTFQTYCQLGQPLGTGSDYFGDDEWGGWGCQLSWQFMYSNPSGDMYRFKRTFWWKGGNPTTQTCDITYTGTRVLVFEDKVLRIEMRPGTAPSDMITTSPDRWWAPSAGKTLLVSISVTLAISLLWRATASTRTMPALSTVTQSRVLDYATSELRTRQASGAWDWCVVGLVAACYGLAGHAQHVMPGGYSWSYDWEYASFLMTVAAAAATVLFFASLGRIIAMGRRRCPIALIISIWMSGALVVLLTVFTRWLQRNFA